MSDTMIDAGEGTDSNKLSGQICLFRFRDTLCDKQVGA